MLIGGTMGTCSYVLTGTQQGMNETFGSTCHGAVSSSFTLSCSVLMMCLSSYKWILYCSEFQLPSGLIVENTHIQTAIGTFIHTEGYVFQVYSVVPKCLQGNLWRLLLGSIFHQLDTFMSVKELKTNTQSPNLITELAQ